ncbi:GNAT family N-acetyltransferase [Bifidobacterium sp. BRDM6]|uniref:GNAT family N-acetyltransferase n=2 Tax=Bifidobacterium choloepi TaxID=2614131 RepID=A0A6I5NK06_9BIFI|nr:GNAT family N-acetyltransferase [Bifidobacterium choloepi]
MPTRDNVLVKTATGADLEVVRTLGAQCFTETFAADNTAEDMERYLAESFSAERVRAELENPDSAFAVAYVDGEPAGYLKTNVGAAQTEKQGADSLEVERIYLLRRFKGLGIGGLLMDEALARAARLDKRRVWLGVWEHNDAARGFYEHRGFRPFGDHVFVLGDDRQRDVLMEREVPGTR